MQPLHFQSATITLSKCNALKHCKTNGFSWLGVEEVSHGQLELLSGLLRYGDLPTKLMVLWKETSQGASPHVDVTRTFVPFAQNDLDDLRRSIVHELLKQRLRVGVVTAERNDRLLHALVVGSRRGSGDCAFGLVCLLFIVHFSAFAAPEEAQEQVERRLLLDVVVGQRTAILQLLTGEDQTLLIRRDAFLILDLGLADLVLQKKMFQKITKPKPTSFD